MKKLVFFWLFISLLAFSPVARAAPASSPVPLDSWVYPALDKLAGLGLITSSIQGMRPIARLEAARQVREADEQSSAEGAPPVVYELLARLEVELEAELTRLREAGEEKSYFQPLRTTELSYIYRDGDDAFYPGNNARQFPLNTNNFGIDYGEGHNAQLTFESEANLGGWLSLSARPLYEVQENGADGLHLLTGRAALGLGPFEFSAGRQALWWGQGRHGTLLLSNNAEPLDMLRVNNPSPVLLPWIFRFLGPFRFDIFVSELEEDRVVPEPYFGGVRLAFKPLPWLELGGSRTVIFGGEGRPEIKLDDFLVIVGGENLEEGDTSNSLADLNGRITLPFLWNAQLYGEWGGEDEGKAFDLPPYLVARAWLAGLYLPQIEPGGRLSFRFEYTDLADLRQRDSRSPWYRHSVYGSGYTYEEKIMGHHAGPDTEDYFFELKAYMPYGLTLGLEYDYEKRGQPLAAEEKHHQPAVELEWAANRALSLRGRYAFDRVKNFAFVEGNDRDFHFAEISLRYLW